MPAETKGVKLTKAQMEFLSDMAARPQTSFDGYKPAMKLVTLGFATRQESRFGSVSFAITPAGRSALAAHERGQDSHGE